MKKIFSFLLLTVLSIQAFTSHADEGMWLPLLLKRNYKDMKEKGLKLKSKELYNINKSSLKDAIVSLGGFCTGEMISSKGHLLEQTALHHPTWPAMG